EYLINITQTRQKPNALILPIPFISSISVSPFLHYLNSYYKYTIIGSAISGKSIYSCGKIVELLDKNYFIITFHETR
ncbi:hypothetical protein KKG56_03190, partial [bacterium]|nr:hypothetical protein [bacterium]